MAGEYFFYQGNHEKAIQYWSRIIKDNDTDNFGGETLFCLATCYFNTGDIQKSIQLYETVYEKYPKVYYAYRIPWLLGSLYRMAKDCEKAIYCFDLQKEDPSGALKPRTLFSKGCVYLFDLKDPGSAEKIFETYINRYPEGESIQTAYYCLGLCYSRLGKKNRAIEILQEALKKYAGHMIETDIKTLLSKIKNQDKNQELTE